MTGTGNKIQLIGIFSFACMLFCGIVRLLFHFSGRILLLFWFSEIFVVFLPGIVAALYIYKEGTKAEVIALGYGIGYGINIIEYLILYTLHLKKFCVFFVSVIVVAALYILLKKQRDVDYENEKGEPVLLLVFLGYLLVNIIAYSGNAISPMNGMQGLCEIPRDVQYWCSNAVSLKNSFLPNATFFKDGMLFYHYFSSLHIGFISRVTGIDVFSLAFTLYPFGKCILFVGALNFLLNRFKTGNGKWFLLCIVLIMSGKEAISVVTYGWHSIENPFGCDIGIAFGFWYLATFILLIRKDKFDSILCGANLLFWFICCSVKAPIAALLIFVPFFYCCLWLVQRRFGKAFGYGSLIVGFFLIVNIICAGMLRVFEGASGIDGNSYSIKLYPVGSRIIHSEYGWILGLAHSVIYKMYYSNPVLCIVTAINIIVFLHLIKTKRIKRNGILLELVMLATTLIGFCMGVFINAGGNSEMYFSIAAFLPSIIFNAGMIDCGWMKSQIWHNDYRRRFIQLTVICLGLYGTYLMSFESYGGGLVTFLQEGHNRMEGIGSFSSNSFSQDEARACIWIREHSREDAVVLNDRNTIGGQNHMYYYGIFTERPQYIEATDLLIYVKLNKDDKPMQEGVDERMNLAVRLYENDLSALGQLKEDGVRYVIQNNQITPEFIYEEEALEKRFSSGDITVYEIR